MCLPSVSDSGDDGAAFSLKLESLSDVKEIDHEPRETHCSVAVHGVVERVLCSVRTISRRESEGQSERGRVSEVEREENRARESE